MTQLQDITDILNDERKLIALVDKINRNKRKSGLPEIAIDVIRTEYTLAKAVEEAKAENNLDEVSKRMNSLIEHQKQYGL